MLFVWNPYPKTSLFFFELKLGEKITQFWVWLAEIFIGCFLQKVSLCIGWPNNSCKIIVHWIARWQLLFLNWGHRKNLSWNCWAEINQLPIQKSERIYCPRREQASQICARFSLRLEFEIGLFNSESPQIYKSVLMMSSSTLTTTF